jgi:hypothetical protein
MIAESQMQHQPARLGRRRRQRIRAKTMTQQQGAGSNFFSEDQMSHPCKHYNNFFSEDQMSHPFCGPQEGDRPRVFRAEELVVI